VVSGGIGIAQLYRHFGVMPRFYLTDAGVQNTPSGPQLWREYVLHGGGIECRIREDFCPDYLNLHGPDAGTGAYPCDPAKKGLSDLGTPAESSPSKRSSLGDLMQGLRCSNMLDDVAAGAASPLQRVLLTATGNVLRILTSYYRLCISVSLKRSSLIRDSSSQYQRCVDMVCNGVAFCRARSCITLDSDMTKLVDSGECDVGGIFRQRDLLPEFELLSVKLESSETDIPGFGRHYLLKAPGIHCDIVEEFSEITLSLSDIGSLTVLPGIPIIFPNFTVKP